MKNVYRIFAYNEKEFRIYDNIEQFQNDNFDYDVYYVVKIVEKYLKRKVVK